MPTERVTGRVIERSFPLGARPEVHVNNVRGHVRVTGGADEAAHLRIEVDPEGRLPEEDIERAPIDIEQEGNALRVKVLSDKMIMGWFERRSGPPNIRISLELPVASRVSVSCVSADAAIAGLEGRQAVNTVSGRIVATDIRGDLHLNTVSGDALVTRSEGALRWNSVSGTLMAREGRTTGLQGNSVSGGVELATEDGLSAGAQVQTVSGNFRLSVPPTFGCEAQLSSMSGGASCALPARVVESRRGRWHATVNGGGPLVRLASMSGSLQITSGQGAVAGREGRGGVEADVPTDANVGEAAGRSGSSGPAAGDERLRILQRVERKEISIEEALSRLDALRQAGTSSEGAR